MRLRKNDLMKCKQCGVETKVKDLKQVGAQQDETGVLSNLICPFCDCPCLEKGEPEMNLEEKAKTLQEWKDEITYIRQGKLLVPENVEQVKQRLVLLSDAQQDNKELMKENRMLKDLLANHDDLVTRNVKLEKIHGELKQKLEEWKRQINESIAAHKERRYYPNPDWVLSKIKEFEELLQE